MDAETMEAIEKWAADEFRSTNGQLQWIIAEALDDAAYCEKNPRNSPLVLYSGDYFLFLFLFIAEIPFYQKRSH